MSANLQRNMGSAAPESANGGKSGSPQEVLLAFLRLGLTSFGGPIAHLGYFHDAFVVRRKWLDEKSYADLVALCQFLPGPASSQVGIGIGLSQAGYAGALAAWLGFTLPSAVLMVLAGLGLASFRKDVPEAALHGLLIVAVAVVAQAVFAMAQRLCPDWPRRGLALLAALAALAFEFPLAQVAIIAAGAVMGPILVRIDAPVAHSSFGVTIPRATSVALIALFFVLLFGLPLAAQVSGNHTLALIAGFYQSGALVFGGGHVVLPLLQSAVVTKGWMSNDAFLAGYGAAQAVPGPLFTFAAYLGTIMGPEPNGVAGGIICLLAIFAPSFLLIFGALPFWDALRARPVAQTALAGVNAAVVGLLLAALYNPVWIAAIHSYWDFAIALGAFGLLVFAKAPPWVAVIACVASRWILAAAFAI